ncbi:MAG: hypothetical protein KDB00_24290 [Planctomycetales bacterium]|nr:hypothetical protein [Planctomycetales bacterium]
MLRFDAQQGNSNDDTFQQSCDICGRPTIISSRWAGECVGCRHCGGSFVAVNGSQIITSATAQQSVRPHERKERDFARSYLLRIAASCMTAVGNLFGESL